MSCCFFQALDLTVQLMEMGEKALIEAGAKYAYGALGRWDLQSSDYTDLPTFTTFNVRLSCSELLLKNMQVVSLPQ